MRNVDEIKMAADDIKKKWGGIDILFNNAGIITGNKNFHEFTHEDIENTMRINSNALMHVALEFLPGMIAQKSGHIVNIASAAGLMPNPKLSVYCASKHAVIGWAKACDWSWNKFQKTFMLPPLHHRTSAQVCLKGCIRHWYPLVRPQVAAKAIINGVKKNKIYVRMPWIVYSVPFIKGLLPQRWMDFLTGKIFGFHKSMDAFRGKTN